MVWWCAPCTWTAVPIPHHADWFTYCTHTGALCAGISTPSRCSSSCTDKSTPCGLHGCPTTPAATPGMTRAAAHGAPGVAPQKPARGSPPNATPARHARCALGSRPRRPRTIRHPIARSTSTAIVKVLYRTLNHIEAGVRASLLIIVGASKQRARSCPLFVSLVQPMQLCYLSRTTCLW